MLLPTRCSSEGGEPERIVRARGCRVTVDCRTRSGRRPRAPRECGAATRLLRVARRPALHARKFRVCRRNHPKIDPFNGALGAHPLHRGPPTANYRVFARINRPASHR